MKKKAIPYPKCYAKHLGNCDGKSAEHYISKSVLEVIGPVEVTGFPWLKQGTSKAISHNALTAKVLCSNHNSALSNLDSEASKFINHLKLLDSKETARNLELVPSKLVVDGLRLEKWILKTLCGIMASGNFMTDGKGHGSVAVPEYFVDLLYKDDLWKTGIGLYTELSNRIRIDAFRGIGYAPVIVKSGTHSTIVGIDIHFWGFPLRCLFAVHENVRSLEKYRPRGITVVNGSVTREIIFTWPATSFTSNPPIFTRTGTIFQNKTD